MALPHGRIEDLSLLSGHLAILVSPTLRTSIAIWRKAGRRELLPELSRIDIVQVKMERSDDAVIQNVGA